MASVELPESHDGMYKEASPASAENHVVSERDDRWLRNLSSVACSASIETDSNITYLWPVLASVRLPLCRCEPLLIANVHRLLNQ